MKALTFAVLVFAGSILAAQTLSTGPSTATEPSAKAQARLEREVQHELLMQPYYGVFDIIKYSVNGYNVTLSGQVTRPSIKSDAIAAVKSIEGVERVDDQIKVLPPSSSDDQLRLALFQSIYGFAPLQKYALGTLKPIRIIVERGHVTLEGVVDNETDRNTAAIRANSVPGIIGQISNNLRVQDQSAKK